MASRTPKTSGWMGFRAHFFLRFEVDEAKGPAQEAAKRTGRRGFLSSCLQEMSRRWMSRKAQVAARILG